MSQSLERPRYRTFCQELQYQLQSPGRTGLEGRHHGCWSGRGAGQQRGKVSQLLERLRHQTF